MFAGKPVIGIVGGIGSGKTFVARAFGELGCLVIDSDQQVSEAYQSPAVRQVLREWWGDAVFAPDGQINRKAIADRIFNDLEQRRRLEKLLHPSVNEARIAVMQQNAANAQVLAFVWDTPLLIETGLNQQCDAVVFVDAPLDQRLARVNTGRGWGPAELESREKLQRPLDKKREISDYMVSNTAGAYEIRVQVREVLSRIFAGLTPTTGSQ